MSIEGVDVSNHQATFDFRGWQFAIIKSSEGNGFRDFRFTQHLSAARAAGLLVAAYHYQRDVSARSQFDLIRSMVPTSIPVAIDVEDGSGSLNITRELISLLRNAGYSVPLLYLPRWYWDRIGRPNLAGLPPLWGSDYRGGSADWSNYGGLSVALRQYTSTPFDKNWFGGTREQFAALLGGSQEGDDDVSADEVWNYPMQVVHGDGTTHQANAVDVLRYSELAEEITRNLVREVKSLVEGINANVNDIKRRVAELETGGVSEAQIAEIAKDAVAEDLKNDEE